MTDGKNRQMVLRGLALSPGMALGHVCMFRDMEQAEQQVVYSRPGGSSADLENSRVGHAFDIASDRLAGLVMDVRLRVGSAEADIFEAQKMIIDDPALRQKIFDEISAHGLNAESAVFKVIDEYKRRMLSAGDRHMRERAADVEEIKRRLLDVLANNHRYFYCHGDDECQRGRNRIIVATELTPSLTVEINTRQTLGFVTEHGGRGSHAAILAQSMGIPAVSGIRNIKDRVRCGTQVFVNGHSGEVVINPSREYLEKYSSAQIRTSESVAVADSIIGPVKGLRIMANISLSKDVEQADMFQAEGIGLYRTEFEFFAAGSSLDEDEQFRRYLHVEEKMGGRPVYFRMLDIGGDKSAPFFDIPKEENPYLGLRGSRFLIENNGLVETQARALARVSATTGRPVYVMYPMIIDLAQFRLMRERVVKAAEQVSGARFMHGLMFEVPSACMQADEILEHADFASIGTNDLIQYLFAVDRNNERVAYDYTPDRAAFWNIVRQMAETARKRGKPLSICGQMADSTQHIAKLIEIGIDTVSVNPRNISVLRSHVSKLAGLRRV